MKTNPRQLMLKKTRFLQYLITAILAGKLWQLRAIAWDLFLQTTSARQVESRQARSFFGPLEHANLNVHPEGQCTSYCVVLHDAKMRAMI